MKVCILDICDLHDAVGVVCEHFGVLLGCPRGLQAALEESFVGHHHWELLPLLLLLLLRTSGKAFCCLYLIVRREHIEAS